MSKFMRTGLIMMLLFSLSLLAGAGCSGGSEKATEVLNGKWKISIEEMKKMPEIKDKPDMEMALNMMGSMVISFDTKTSKMLTDFMGQSMAVDFKILEDKGNSLVMEIEGQKSELVVMDKDTIKLGMPGDTGMDNMVLIRIK